MMGIPKLKPRANYRLQLETLEERLTPSTDWTRGGVGPLLSNSSSQATSNNSISSIQGPTVTPPGSQAAPEATPTIFNLGSFTDPFAEPPWAVDVDWGDNTPHTGLSVNSEGTLPSQSHTYGSEGTYTITITITDSNTASASGTSQVFVGGFVTSLYRDVLGRLPDPAGLQSWVTLFHTGVSRQSIATGFWLSPEHRGIEVDRFYQQILGRNADGIGRAAWVNALLAGVSEADVVGAFFTSPEFQAQHADRGSFVNGVMLGVLGRPASSAELATLPNLIDDEAASRTRLVLTILSNDETYIAAINNLYTEFLDRTPSGPEVQGWLTLLRTGTLNSTSVAAMFLGSTEYFQRALFEANFLPPPP